MVANAVMPPTDDTLKSLVTKNSVEFLGEVHFAKREGKTRRQSGQSEQGKKKILTRAVLQLFPFWPFDKDTYFLTFCEMRQEFNFVVQCKTQCGLDLQIEIPDESPR